MNIDIANFITSNPHKLNEINGGVTSGGIAVVNNFPITGNYVYVINKPYNGSNAYVGFWQNGNLKFATNPSPASPKKFGAGATIDGSSYFTGEAFNSLFQFVYNSNTYTSPDFGANSYMGFKTSEGNYGYLQVTWTSATNTFYVLSGAYESVVGADIITPAAIPEPTTNAMLGIGALLIGGAALRSHRKNRQLTKS